MSLLTHMSKPHVLVFDSGVGGLSVSAEIRRLLPHVAQSYLADDAFRPYGEKTEKALRTRLTELLTPMCDMLRPDIVVIACNSASTTALPAIRDALNIPVVGVVPAIKPAAALSKTGSIAVLGTPGTVRRSYVDALIAEFAANCRVELVGSTALVEEAESKLAGGQVNLSVLRRALAPIFAKGEAQNPVDAIVLACTHFPLLEEELNRLVPSPVTWVDSGAAIARRVDHLLGGASPQGRPPKDSTAFLTGPLQNDARKATFARYGFNRVVSLM